MHMIHLLRSLFAGMTNMQEILKYLPISVLLSLIFLLSVWIIMMMINPIGTIGFTVIVFTIASTIRIIMFLKNPK